MEQWNNVELSDMSKKSYTLNHEYDNKAPKDSFTNNNNNSSEQNSNGNNKNTETSNGDDVGQPKSSILQPGSDIKPKVKTEEVESLVRRLYGITTSEIKELISYDDRNYLIKEDR